MEPEIDQDASNRWLKYSTSMICAIQEQAITTTPHIQRKTHHTTNYNITSGCVAMAPTKYLKRHDNVCKHIHHFLLNEFGFKEHQTAWYQGHPRPVEENGNAKIWWNFSVTEWGRSSTQHNRPDIIVIDKENNKELIINGLCRTNTMSVENIWSYTDRPYCPSNCWSNWCNL